MARGNRLAMLILSGSALFTWTADATRAEAVWTEPITKSLALSVTNVKELHVATHNGSITFTGDPIKPPAVTVTLKGGGKSAEEARKALLAIELLAPAPESGVADLGWRWKEGTQHREWRASVSFDIVAPPALGLYAQTHNGPVRVARIEGDVAAGTHNGKIGISDASGDVVAETHNGRMKIRTTGEKLTCRTHNGRIDIQFTGTSMKLDTHNGIVVANVAGATTIGGNIATHNGSVELIVDEKTATHLKCSTHRGAMHCDAPLSAMEVTKTKLGGKLGGGGGGGAVLEIKTNNGPIEVLLAD